MRRIRVLNEFDEERYGHDVDRIVDALASDGILATRAQAYRLWEQFSTSMAAGWMNLPDDGSEIVTNVRPYFTVEGEDETPLREFEERQSEEQDYEP